MIRARRKSPWQRRRRPKNSASSRKSCSEEGCTTLANRWGLCSKHGGFARCSEEGCDKAAVKGGLCKAHYSVANGEVGS